MRSRRGPAGEAPFPARTGGTNCRRFGVGGRVLGFLAQLASNSASVTTMARNTPQHGRTVCLQFILLALCAGDRDKWVPHAG